MKNTANGFHRGWAKCTKSPLRLERHAVRALCGAALFWVALGIAPGGAVRADEIQGLYEAEVPVLSQNVEDRNAAISAALLQVLVKVSSRAAVNSAPQLQEVLDSANRFVQQYRYLRADPAQKSKDKDGDAPPGQVLWVRFDEQAINAMLRANGLPVWGRTRPAALVWLALSTRGQRKLVSASSKHEARTLLREGARRRGVPLRFPLFDLDDRKQVQMSDLWGDFADPVLRASQRYKARAVLVGRASRSGDQWLGRWTLYVEGSRHSWETRGAQLSDMIDPGIDEAAEILAARFAQMQHETVANSLLVRVNGIDSLPAYDRTIRYLTGLDIVEGVQPYLVETDSVIFRITARSGRLALAQAVALGHTLASDALLGTVPQPAVFGGATTGETGQGATGVPDSGPGGAVAPVGAADDGMTPAVVPALIPDLVYQLVP
ncbi:MAG: DUF2066 domain-containing protein [Pseudomonadota bacterium]|nr:MAG: DUF2066 domain-containing protein [Pseudomonadota bacterium]